MQSIVILRPIALHLPVIAIPRGSRGEVGR